MTDCIPHVWGWEDLLPYERDEGEAHVPLTLPNSGLMLSPWSEKKTNGCWELLLLGVSHLERALPTFIRPSACPHVLSGLFLVFLSVPSPLISVSLYPFNDFFFFFYNTLCSWDKRVTVNSLQLFYGQDSAFSKSFQRLLCMFPLALFLNVNTLHSPFFVGRALWPVPSPALWEAGFCYFFAGSEQNRILLGEKMQQEHF